MPLAYDVVQAAQIGLQTTLVRELKMSIPSANRMTEDAGKEIEKLFLSRESAAEKRILFAVRVEPARWMPINLDTIAATIDKELETTIWVIVDVGHFVAKVCDAVAAKDPDAYAAWLKKTLAKNN